MGISLDLLALEKAEEAARQFLESAKIMRSKVERKTLPPYQLDAPPRHYVSVSPKYTADVRRKSMELTRSLADLRGRNKSS